MQTLTLTLAAGQTAAFDISGAYFEIIDAPATISVNFYDANGSRTKDLEMLKVLSGTFIKGRFSRFELSESSGVTQTITVMYGSTEGGTRRSPGVVLVSYPISTTAQVIDAVDTATGSAAGFQIARTLVMPAANLKGVRVHSVRLGVVGNASGTSDLRLVAAPSTPTSLSPANSWAGSQAGSTNGVNGNEIQQRMNVTLPAGWGLYLCVNNSGTTPPQVVYSSICFELI